MNEAENTFRALKDEPPLATSFWCKFGIHKWTKWSKPQVRKTVLYVYHEQYRECSHCGTFGIKQLMKE